MNNPRFDSILLLGNHGNLFKGQLDNNTELSVRTLVFKKRQAFVENDPHQLILNGVSIDYNGKYVLDELAFALSVILNHNKSLQNILIVGDPSELLYQAFVYAKTNQNPNMIKEEVQFLNPTVSDAFIFIYPLGMVAKDIRKEISQVIYVLKKFKKNTFLIRTKESDEASVLQKMLNALSYVDEVSTFNVKGVEQLISNQAHYST